MELKRRKPPSFHHTGPSVLPPPPKPVASSRIGSVGEMILSRSESKRSIRFAVCAWAKRAPAIVRPVLPTSSSILRREMSCGIEPLLFRWQEYRTGDQKPEVRSRNDD